MPEYRFQYYKGQSRPSHGITAKDDRDAFVQMIKFAEKGGYTYVEGSMTTSSGGMNFRKVADLAGMQLHATNEGMR